MPCDGKFHTMEVCQGVRKDWRREERFAGVQFCCEKNGGSRTGGSWTTAATFWPPSKQLQEGDGGRTNAWSPIWLRQQFSCAQTVKVP
jgi:hypothetical protein